MKTAKDYALDLQDELEDKGGLEPSANPHERDVDVTTEGTAIIARHIEKIIADARAEPPDKRPQSMKSPLEYYCDFQTELRLGSGERRDIIEAFLAKVIKEAREAERRLITKERAAA